MNSVNNAIVASNTMQSMALNTQVSNSVLKKAIHLQAAGTLALVQGITTLSSANLPDHLGQNINTTA